RSRFGARLEPFSRVEVQLHVGRGELATVTGAELLQSFEAVRSDYQRVAAAHIAVETMLRLFVEHDPSPQAYEALLRFLEALEARRPVGASPATDPLVLAFGLKILWVAGLVPHLEGCVSCGAAGPLVAFSAPRGGATCAACREGTRPLSPAARSGMLELLGRPLAEAHRVGLRRATAREVLRTIEGIHAHHGGFQLRTLARA
ncbi:MAG: DNA repair protein RecO, partial [Gaiellales bacterium]